MVLVLVVCLAGAGHLPAWGADRPAPAALLRSFLAAGKDPRSYWLQVLHDTRGTVVTGGDRIHPNQVVQMKIVGGRRVNAPMVKVHAAGDEEYVALLDLSSSASWIPLDTAMALGVVAFRPPISLPAEHVRDDVPAYLSVLRTMFLDTLQIESVIFRVRSRPGSLGPLARGIARPRPAMVLGYGLLSRFRFVRFDYQSRRITFSTTLPYPPADDRRLAEVSFSQDGGAVVIGGQIDGVPRRILVDPAGDFALVLPDGGGGVVRQVTIGDLVLRNVPTRTSASGEAVGRRYAGYVRIGRRLLSRFTVILENRMHRLIIEKPAR